MCLLNAARFQMFTDKKKLHLTCVKLITTHLCVFLYVHFFFIISIWWEQTHGWHHITYKQIQLICIVIMWRFFSVRKNKRNNFWTNLNHEKETFLFETCLILGGFRFQFVPTYSNETQTHEQHCAFKYPAIFCVILSPINLVSLRWSSAVCVRTELHGNYAFTRKRTSQFIDRLQVNVWNIRILLLLLQKSR